MKRGWFPWHQPCCTVDSSGASIRIQGDGFFPATCILDVPYPWCHTAKMTMILTFDKRVLFTVKKVNLRFWSRIVKSMLGNHVPIKAEISWIWNGIKKHNFTSSILLGDTSQHKGYLWKQKQNHLMFPNEQNLMFLLFLF